MNFFTHFGRYLLMLKGMFSRPENMRLYWKELMHQCNEIGIRSVGIVVIISIFLGAVTTVQTAYQLITPLIPKTVIAIIVRDNIILELAPTLICVVLAGVVGSRIASELGNMRISEQIDALLFLLQCSVSGVVKWLVHYPAFFLLKFITMVCSKILFLTT